ncbi:uncharacterized protein LOC132538000 isoform X2 [Erinaceus europaeus]|uniref:Uncharacterized protein LOC132538000 isoform X2 n=1 Tax=Erinaceus europaeus TaxID=9365 RepID=A0ABM3X7V3_ERIEU|nr:uncharacterized protein LOC132538000 isoform X2 [Erinaceus europaeus]
MSLLAPVLFWLSVTTPSCPHDELKAGLTSTVTVAAMPGVGPGMHWVLRTWYVVQGSTDMIVLRVRTLAVPLRALQPPPPWMGAEGITGNMPSLPFSLTTDPTPTLSISQGRKLRLRQAWPPAQGHTARNHGQPKQGEPRAPRTLAKLARCVAWKTLSERSPFLELCPTRHTAFCPDSRSPSSHLDLLPALSASSPKPGTRACIVFQGRLRTCLGPINTWSQRNAQGPSPVLSLTSLEWVGEPVGLQLLHRTRRLCLWVCVVGSPGNAYWLPRNHSQPQSQQDQSVELSPP